MWIVPSRFRPYYLGRLIEACLETGLSGPVLARVDDDDPLLSEYRALALPDTWRLAVGPRKGLAAIYNDIFAAAPAEDFYGLLADDLVPETTVWGRTLTREAGRDGLAFGDDGINGGRLATHPVLGGDLVRRTGWLALPGLDRLFIDTVWTQIARAAGVLRYRPDVKVTHWHFSNGRALMDRTYRKPRSAEDRAIYQAWLAKMAD